MTPNRFHNFLSKNRLAADLFVCWVRPLRQ
nr:MAG TPA_asm: hypothetical protein [Caudoviricetes sp.]